MRSLVLITAFFSVLGLVDSAYAARERIVLDMYDTMYTSRRGEAANKIRLKQEIRDQYGAINLQRSRLVAVKVVGKSRQGQGSVALMVDGFEQDRARLQGNRREFRSNQRYTYDNRRLENYGGSAGTWQLELRGRAIKIKEVVVIIEKRRRQGGGNGNRPRNLTYSRVGSEKIEWISQDTDTWDVYQNNVWELKLTAEKQSIDVYSVKVRFGNGTSRNLPMLAGKLSKGKSKIAELRGRDVVSVTVRAQSRNQFDSRGKLVLYTGVRRR